MRRKKTRFRSQMLERIALEGLWPPELLEQLERYRRLGGRVSFLPVEFEEVETPR